jgi:predicted NACHT family NTPase
MNNLNSELVCNFPSLINTEAVKLECKHVVKFSHKWLQLKEPVELNKLPQKNSMNEINYQIANQQIAGDPLLKLLCLLFEEESEIPSKPCQLYKEGLEILLKKWNYKLYLKGDWVYKNLSLPQKQDLLSSIALITFKEGEYFFKQELEKYIADYICNLLKAPTHPEVLQLISEAVLKSIESQHKLLVEQAPGIYSFSDLKFHQYFAAREIVESYNPQASETALKNLAGHIAETRWREVFLLVVGMLRNADHLVSLMKQQTDAIVAVDRELQRFLLWLNQKSNSDKSAYKPATFRAFYLEFILDLDLEDPLDGNLTDYTINPARVDATPEELTISFTKQQKGLLKQYYDANQLLLNCLRQARYVTRAVREEIEENLLVPSASGSKAIA